MSESDWQEVSDRFSGLAEQFKAHYMAKDAEEDTQVVKDALRSLGDAADRVATSVGDAVRDPAVKEQAKDAVNSLLGALSGTFAELGDEFTKLFGGKADEPQKPGDDATHEDDLATAQEEIRQAAGETPPPDEEPPAEAPTYTETQGAAEEADVATDADSGDGDEPEGPGAASS